MEQMGFTAEDYEGDDVEVWPENWPAFQVLVRLQTQWHCAGMNGQPTGLIYQSAYPLLDRAFPDPADWDAAFDDLRVMEAAALPVLGERYEK